MGHRKDAGAIATPTEKLLLEAGEVRWWRLDGANGYSVLVSHGMLCLVSNRRTRRQFSGKSDVTKNHSMNGEIHLNDTGKESASIIGRWT